MHTAPAAPAAGHSEPDNARVLSVYGIILGIGGSLFVMLFWAMAAVLVITNNGGLITELNLQGAWLWSFYAYPFVALLASAAAVFLYMARRHLEAVGTSFAPIGLLVLYFLALHLLR